MPDTVPADRAHAPGAAPLRRPAMTLALVLLGSTGIAAVWIVLALSRDQQLSAMAVVAAIDAAVLLRLGGMSPGWHRAACGVAATALTIVLANWGIASGQVGRTVGMLPWESATHMGPSFAWTLAVLANPPSQWAWLVAGLVVAAVASR